MGAHSAPRRRDGRLATIAGRGAFAAVAAVTVAGGGAGVALAGEAPAEHVTSTHDQKQDQKHDGHECGCGHGHEGHGKHEHGKHEGHGNHDGKHDGKHGDKPEHPEAEEPGGMLPDVEIPDPTDMLPGGGETPETETPETETPETETPETETPETETPETETPEGEEGSTTPITPPAGEVEDEGATPEENDASEGLPKLENDDDATGEGGRSDDDSMEGTENAGQSPAAQPTAPTEPIMASLMSL